MRCPKCNAWMTPDMRSCPECRAEVTIGMTQPVSGESVLEKFRRQIDTDRARRDGADAQGLSIGGVRRNPPSPPVVVDGLERAMAEESALDAEALGVLNLLLLHAGFSPLKSVEVRTTSADGLAGTRLRIEASPPVIQPLTVPLTELGEGGALRSPAVAPDETEFFRLDESVRGQLELALLYEDTVVLERTLPVTVQTPNEWIGLEGVEAALAGAVTPNAPAVVDAASALAGDFVAYQSRDPETLIREVSEVYESIRRLGLSYIGVPPSFEKTGQKVLFPDEVIASKRGCCIDIAVLTASLLERVGYNPLIVVITGHAYSGVWTSDIRAKAPVLRDATVVRRAVEDGDLLVWNSTTYFDREGDDSIGAAIDLGVEMLDQFQYAIDLAACRDHGFKPLPRRNA